ncbi:MAG: phage terminase large subunit [Oscillospiraceae bacterium]|nr:phage terminase large subunit [Oscillospiraceae bacterium]
MKEKSTKDKKDNRENKLILRGKPNAKQRDFFASRTRYTAYGGARGGGKSWALRRKLVLMCLRYGGLRCLLLRRSYSELRGNHILPLLAELSPVVSFSESKKVFTFPNGSVIQLGFCAAESDALRYQGQEYDVIAVDEATQLSEYQFNTLIACLRGTNDFPKRMYLTCNPGGVGHSWVKRLFVDRRYNEGEDGADYSFIPARVYDNDALMQSCPDYARHLNSLPPKLRQAWLDGCWDVFAGQFFPELSHDVHTCTLFEIPSHWRHFAALDYGFDMLAVLLLAVDEAGNCVVYRELALPNLTLSAAAEEVAALCGSVGHEISYIVASPDLWNRRQESGYSGVEIMSRHPTLPPLLKADNRRVMGWRTMREYFSVSDGVRLQGEDRPVTDGKGSLVGADLVSARETIPAQHCGRTQDPPLQQGEPIPRLRIFRNCPEVYRCLTSLVFDKRNPEDAAGEPHAITHLPEALRYALMSRVGGEREDDGDAVARFYGKRRGVELWEW